MFSGPTMDAAVRLLDPARLSELQGLEVKARLIVEGYLAGVHRSPYHGFSVEFAEHREYVPGDDLRYVDWKVFGKTDRFYLKLFDEETNFSCTVMCDVSESMSYQSSSAVVSKLEYARWLAAALAFLVIQQHDAVGLATFDSAVRDFLRPSGTAGQLKEICRLLEAAPATGESAIGPILQTLAERMTRRGVVIVISDFFDDFASLERGLRHLSFRRHDAILLQVLDAAEVEFPFSEPTVFHGLEGWSDLQADPRSIQRNYQKELQHHLARMRGLARELKFDYALFTTDHPPVPPLAALFSNRKERRGA